jgi:hypothetical protein
MLTALRKPRYWVARTLLGGEPDVNRRTIIDSWNQYEDVVTFNQEMDEWTRKYDATLRLVLAALEATNGSSTE